MINPPTSRVDTPQLVAQGYSRWPAWFWKVTSKALEKFWPRKWLVPDCKARQSCIRASMHKVYTAPGNFCPSLLGPVKTGMAIQSSANVL